MNKQTLLELIIFILIASLPVILVMVFLAESPHAVQGMTRAMLGY